MFTIRINKQKKLVAWLIFLLSFLQFRMVLPVLALDVDPSTRIASQDFYRNYYLPDQDIDPDFQDTDHNLCIPGHTSATFREATINRVNYFRAMAGVPANVVINEELSQKAQQAALIMSRNKILSHYPTPLWKCYSPEGAVAASNSNLVIYGNGPIAINGYMIDFGNSNYFVGHRRHILFPKTTQMGSGDVPSGRFNLFGTWFYSDSLGAPANALWVFFLEDLIKPRPPTRHQFVAWPPPGYVPYTVVYRRWSFSFPNADFSKAKVTLLKNGISERVALETTVTGYSDNTLVWYLENLSPSIALPWPKPEQDTSYDVTVENVLINGAANMFTYRVVVFDPDVQSTGPGDIDGKQYKGEGEISQLNRSSDGSLISLGVEKFIGSEGYPALFSEISSLPVIYCTNGTQNSDCLKLGAQNTESDSDLAMAEKVEIAGTILCDNPDISSCRLIAQTVRSVDKCGDLDRDNDVDSSDLVSFLGYWTGEGGLANQLRDFNNGDCDGDSDVDSSDMLELIGNWTGAL